MKNTQVANDSENEFDVDEPDEVQNASDDDWTPEVTGRRQSSRLRGSARPTFAEVSTSEEEFSEEDEEDFDSEEEGSRKRRSKQKRGGGGRKPKRARVTSTTNENSDSQGADGENKSAENSDSEPSSTTVTNAKNSKEFSSGSFVVLKTDLANEGDPPLWKIDGKALLQKYIPFEQQGKTFYKNTSVYSGWTVNNKNQYYAATVIFKQQNRKEHIVEFQRHLINNKKGIGKGKSNKSSAEEPEKSPEEEPEKSPAEEPEKSSENSPRDESEKSPAAAEKSPSNSSSPVHQEDEEDDQEKTGEDRENGEEEKGEDKENEEQKGGVKDDEEKEATDE